jgi:hypothetical protein
VETKNLEKFARAKGDTTGSKISALHNATRVDAQVPIATVKEIKSE